MDKIRPIIKQHFSELKAQRGELNSKVGIVLFFHDSGVNALMQKAKLQEQRTIIDNTSEINSWFNELISLSSLPNSIHDDKQLQSYTKELLKAHKASSLDLITICIDIHAASLMSPKGLITELNLIKKNINGLCAKLPFKPALYLTFTQLDKIAGFCHTFKEADVEKSWGYPFTPYLNEASLIQQQNERFKELIQELHETLLEKLHHTEDKLSRYLIREFPLQMESLTNMIRACVKHLSQEACTTCGVFFTSAKQGNHANDRLSKHITQAFSLTPIDKIPQSSLNRAFFIKGWLDTLTAHQNAEAILKKNNGSLKPYVLSGALTFALSTVAISLYVYHSSSLLSNAHQQLVNSSSSTSSNNDFTLTLESLYQASKSATNATNALSLPTVKDFAINTKKQYQNGLNKLFLPNLKNQIERNLHSKKEPLETFLALKAYLILGEKGAVDEEFLFNWITENWQPTLTKSQKARAKLFLGDALKKPYQGMLIDNQLVSNTRNFLLALPKDYLLFGLAKPSLPKGTTDIEPQDFSISLSKVPDIYNRNHFIKTFNETLPKAAEELKNDSFVLGSQQGTDFLGELQSHYLRNYLAFWQSFIKHSQPKTFDNYQNGQELFVKLAKEGSALEKLTTFVQMQTAPFEKASAPAEKEFNKVVANSFSNLQLVTPYQEQLVRTEFANLAKYFANFHQMNDGGFSAFSFAKKRFTSKNASDPLSRLYDLANELPSPIAGWINAINDNTWFLILLNTERYINDSWNQHVYQLYHLKLKDKFPFNDQSNSEISLKEFADFLGPNGTLTTFLNNTLGPFIDTSIANWKVKSLNRLGLPISEESLKEIMRANVIKEIFYPNNKSQPAIEFSLHTVATDPVISSLELDINQQVLKEKDHQKSAMDFVWPNKNGTPKTQVKFNKVSGETLELVEDGDWGLFKLLKQANFSPVEDDPQNYQLVLDINGNSAKFLLSTKSPLNPFVPKLLTSFNLPHRLS